MNNPNAAYSMECPNKEHTQGDVRYKKQLYCIECGTKLVKTPYIFDELSQL